MLISIICVYNNKEVLDKYLLESLKTQNEEYELVLIDNRNNKFSSAASALNYGGKKAKGELLFFVHQDVEFYENNLKDIKYYFKKCENLGIAGVQGVSEENNGRIITNIVSGIPKTKVTDYNIKYITETQTLDELLLIIPNKVFNKYHFDEETCYDWHLYGADYCLNIKQKGFSVVLFPITLYHVSKGGSMSLEYFKTLQKVLDKYKYDYDRIYTNCLLSHDPNNQLKLNLIYFLEILHLRTPITNFLSNFNFLKRIIK